MTTDPVVKKMASTITRAELREWCTTRAEAGRSYDVRIHNQALVDLLDNIAADPEPGAPIFVTIGGKRYVVEDVNHIGTRRPSFFLLEWPES